MPRFLRCRPGDRKCGEGRHRWQPARSRRGLLPWPPKLLRTPPRVARRPPALLAPDPCSPSRPRTSGGKPSLCRRGRAPLPDAFVRPHVSALGEFLPQRGMEAGLETAKIWAVRRTPRAVSLWAEGLQGSGLFILDFGYDYIFFTIKANWLHSRLRSGNLDTSLLSWCKMTQCYLPPPDMPKSIDLPCWPPLASHLNTKKKKSLSTRAFFCFKKGKKSVASRGPLFVLSLV